MVSYFIPMQTKPASQQAVKLSISLPREVAAWMRRAVAKKPGYTISAMIRDLALPEYEKRHAK